MSHVKQGLKPEVAAVAAALLVLVVVATVPGTPLVRSSVEDIVMEAFTHYKSFLG